MSLTDVELSLQTKRSPRRNVAPILGSLLSELSGLQSLTLYLPNGIFPPSSRFPARSIAHLTVLKTNLPHSLLMSLFKLQDCRLTSVVIGGCGTRRPKCPLHVFSDPQVMGSAHGWDYLEGPMSCIPHLVSHRTVAKAHLHYTTDRDLAPASLLLGRSGASITRLHLPITRYSTPRILTPFAGLLPQVQILVLVESAEVGLFFAANWCNQSDIFVQLLNSVRVPWAPWIDRASWEWELSLFPELVEMRIEMAGLRMRSLLAIKDLEKLAKHSLCAVPNFQRLGFVWSDDMILFRREFGSQNMNRL